MGADSSNFGYKPEYSKHWRWLQNWSHMNFKNLLDLNICISTKKIIFVQFHYLNFVKKLSEFRR